ncbi:amidase signature domain-containing protein [Stemphylium lycopersici]|nr:amidase signature domain-containing protein [Stemphylium lycopersici]
MPEFVPATLQYLANNPKYDTEKPYQILINLSHVPGSQKSNHEYETVKNVPITDVRTCDELPTLDEHGFQLETLPNMLHPADFDNNEWVTGEYYPYIENFLKSLLQAKEVMIFEHQNYHGESVLSTKNPDHRWYYANRQKYGEAWVFKLYDSDPNAASSQMGVQNRPLCDYPDVPVGPPPRVLAAKAQNFVLPSLCGVLPHSVPPGQSSSDSLSEPTSVSSGFVSSIDVLTATTFDLIKHLEDSILTSFQLVSEYQHRIARDNKAGLWLNAILSTAPEDNVLQIVKERNEQRKAGALLGPLHGAPFVVKVLDTMVTDQLRSMQTTYGSYALQYFMAPDVAFIIQKTEEAGAIVLGKTNLQPCGSSSGAGGAVSAGFAPVAFGTDTTGMVTCPAAFNSLYGLRSTLGLLPRTGILPTTTSFDTPGLLTKSVGGIALWMVVAQTDPKDPATATSSLERPQSYAKELNGHWKPWRIGALDRPVFGNESIPIWTTQAQDHQMIKGCNETLRRFHTGGAVLVEGIELPMAHLSEEEMSVFDKILNYELKTNLDSYLASLKNTSIHSNRRTALVEAHGIEKVLNDHDLDAVVVPALTWLVQYNAMGGIPFGVIPVGKYDSGRPFGLGFAGRRFDDAELLQIMEAAKKTSVKREVPDVYKYVTLLEKMRYWWTRVNPPTRDPDNRMNHESP